MTAIEFVLMAAMVIVITVGLVRAGGAKHPIARGICLFGAVCVSVFAMAIISTFVREEVKVDTLPHGSYAVQKLPNNSDYLVTEVRPGADKALYPWPALPSSAPTS